MLTEFCNQTSCNVAEYLKTKKGICKACRWQGKLFANGDHWNENGVDFYCSDSIQKVRPGCYVGNSRVTCTGVIPGIRNLLKISNGLFLCESGDEIRSLNDRCNGYTDCQDQSDERNCIHYYCGAMTQGGIHWERTQVNQHNVKNCSLMDPGWQGTFSRWCYLSGRTASWSSLPRRCTCERRGTVNYFKLKVAEVNETNFLDISKELSSSASNFTNKAIFLEMLTEVFNVAVEHLKSSNSNSDLRLLYAEHVIKTISEENIYLERGFCDGSRRCRPPWFSERNALGQRALKLLHEVDKSAVRSIPDIQICRPIRPSNFARTPRQGAVLKVSIWTDNSARAVFSHLNTAPLISNGQDSNSSQAMPYDANITVNRMGFGRSSLSDGIINVLEANGCKNATLDKSGKLIVKGRDPIDDVIKHDQIKKKLEIVLLCISVGAVIVYFIVLLALRIKKSEKTFVHVNLLLTLGLGNLIYVLDKTRFTNRMEFPALCSFVAVSQHFLDTALFTWMLVEGINLYIKMVKVFPVNKQYLVYTAMGWGIPAIIVGAVAAIKPSAYDMGAPLIEEVTCGSLKLILEIERTRCWVNGSLWIYKGPVLFFLLANLALFVIFLRVVFGKLAVTYSQQNIKRASKGLRSIMALLPLLGVTYLLGFFIEFHTAFAYIFILFNSTQGILFSIFHCFLDEQVCEAFKKLRARIKVKRRTNKSSTSNSKAVDTKDLTLFEISKVASHPKSATPDSAPREDEDPYNTRL